MIWDRIWKPGPNRASCLFSRHRSPRPDCDCGFYALYSLDAVAALDSRFVVAAVVGWGDAELHADGWRCEWAQVVALLAPRLRGRRRIRQLAHAYGVPVFTSRAKLRAYAERLAQPPAIAARPQAREPRLTYIMGRPSILLSVGAFVAGAAVLLSPFAAVAGFAAHFAVGASGALWLGVAGASIWLLAVVFVAVSLRPA